MKTYEEITDEILEKGFEVTCFDLMLSKHGIEPFLISQGIKILIEEYGEKSFTIEPDGRCRFSIGFTHLDSAVGFLLSFRGDAQVLGQKEVQEALRVVGKKLTESLERT